eukprot:sb/3477998/
MFIIIGTYNRQPCTSIEADLKARLNHFPQKMMFNNKVQLFSAGIDAFYKQADFEAMFPHRNIDGKAKFKIYEYKHFLSASKKFPKFGTEGSLAMRKREVSCCTN